MIINAAVIRFRHATIAVVLTDASETCPASGYALKRRVQFIFPALGIVLVSPRDHGFSRSYATFDVSDLMKSLDTTKIRWSEYDLVALESDRVEPEAPF